VTCCADAAVQTNIAAAKTEIEHLLVMEKTLSLI